MVKLAYKLDKRKRLIFAGGGSHLGSNPQPCIPGINQFSKKNIFVHASFSNLKNVRFSGSCPKICLLNDDNSAKEFNNAIIMRVMCPKVRYYTQEYLNKY